MILSAAGSLTCTSRLQLGYDFFYRSGVALDWMSNRSTANCPKPLSIPRKVKARDADFLSLDITPDIKLRPIEQRLHPDVFSRTILCNELTPKLRRLILVIPL
jgi:hypothetical protein